MGAILDALTFAGNVLDTPGSIARGVLAGEGRRSLAGILDPSQRVSGREMLENWGALSPNQDGLDMGDVAGFGAEILADPTNWIGGAGLLRRLLNPTVTTALAKGPRYITDDIINATKAAQHRAISGKREPIRVYMGTASKFDGFPDESFYDHGKNLLGRAIYTTDYPVVASGLNKPKLADFVVARSMGHEPPEWMDFVDNMHSDVARSSSHDYGVLNNTGDVIPDGDFSKQYDRYGSYAEVRGEDAIKNTYEARSAVRDFDRMFQDAVVGPLEEVMLNQRRLTHRKPVLVNGKNIDEWAVANKDVLTKKFHDLRDELDFSTIDEHLKSQENARKAYEAKSFVPPMSTRMFYVDMRNPFVLEDVPTKKAISAARNEVLRRQSLIDPRVPTDPPYLYDRLMDAANKLKQMESIAPDVPGVKPASTEFSLTNGSVLEQLFRSIGKEATNEYLKSSGYDGLKHIGGSFRGDGISHNVWAPFSGDQLYLPFMPPTVTTRAYAPDTGRLASAMLGYNAARPWGE